MVEFTKGVPDKSGYYWIRMYGRTEPCKVIQSDRPVAARYGVRVLDGWVNPNDDRFALDDPCMVDAEFAPMETPE